VCDFAPLLAGRRVRVYAIIGMQAVVGLKQDGRSMVGIESHTPQRFGNSSTLSFEKQRPIDDEIDQKCDKRMVVGYDGKWYDVTEFINKHPGGDVIKLFIGQDATDLMNSWHHSDVVKHRKPGK